MNAPDRLYIGETYKITHLLWNGADYTSFNDFDGNAPYYNIGENESESFTLIGAETGEDGLTYLTIKDSDGNTLYLSSTRLKTGALMAPFSEGEDEETPPEPEPVPHDPPQFEKYEQCYPGTGPFAIMYTGVDGKIGSVDDTRYDVEKYKERYFAHLGNGVYVEVESANTVVTIPDNTGSLDITGTKDYPETTYYFSSITHGDRYVINNQNGKTIDENVKAAFFETLQIGEFFGFYRSQDSNMCIIYKGAGRQHDADEHEGVYYDDYLDCYIKGLGANGEFGGQYFGELLKHVDGEMQAPTEKAMIGLGTLSDPYKIHDRSELGWVTDKMASGESFAGKYFKVMNDFSMFVGEVTYRSAEKQNPLPCVDMDCIACHSLSPPYSSVLPSSSASFPMRPPP